MLCTNRRGRLRRISVFGIAPNRAISTVEQETCPRLLRVADANTATEPAISPMPDEDGSSRIPDIMVPPYEACLAIFAIYQSAPEVISVEAAATTMA